MGNRGRDCMVIEFTTTYIIGAYRLPPLYNRYNWKRR